MTHLPTSPQSTSSSSIKTSTAAQSPPNASISVPMWQAARVVPVVINDAITLNFVVDSGAADVSIPPM